MRDLVVKVLVATLVFLFVGGAWLTRNPDAEIVERATEWPVIGPWAERFREAYLPTPQPPGPGEEPEVVYIDRGGRVVDDPERLGDDPDLAVGARPIVWVPQGTRILEEPSLDSAEIVRTGGIANLRVSERRGDWFNVRYRGERGWVYLEDYAESDEPPLGSDPLPPGPLEAYPPDPERLQSALALLEGGGVAAMIGPYVAYLDRERPELVQFLDRLITPLERSYAEHYGPAPIGTADGAIVLFDRRRDFETFQRQETGVVGARATGVASGGIVAVDLDGRDRLEIAATTVHEIVHFLNRRALGPALPAWLEEGLADGLAHARIDDDGTLDPSHLGGLAVEAAGRWEWHGGLASALTLRRAVDEERLPTLSALLAMEWPEFVAAGTSERNYAHASHWVRHLLEDDELAPRFRAYLEGIAGGHSASPDELGRQLDRGWERLDDEFARWVRLRVLKPV